MEPALPPLCLPAKLLPLPLPTLDRNLLPLPEAFLRSRPAEPLLPSNGLLTGTRSIPPVKLTTRSTLSCSSFLSSPPLTPFSQPRYYAQAYAQPGAQGSPAGAQASPYGSAPQAPAPPTSAPPPPPPPAEAPKGGSGQFGAVPPPPGL